MKPLLIFDCDGVLVDSESIASAAFAEHLTQAGYPHTPQQCMERFTGLSLQSCKSLIETGQAPLPEDFFLRLQQDTFDRFAKELEPVPGVVEVLEWLQKQHWPCCVASSGSHEKMALTLEKSGLLKYFGDRIFSASDVQHGKPAPDLFLYAARAQQYSPSHCIVIEDSSPGVLAALAAGMQVCAFGEKHATFADASVFACMSELPAILDAIQDRIFHRQEH